ncbi:hypothetical protein HY621_03670 [Candidatus Uhrbacteria bacterium]|nr:hypothetical protein [Candidatus Uhrbacteria bacterium]
MRKKKADKENQRTKTLNTALLLTVLAMGVFYLSQINTLATKGYVIKGLEKQIQEFQNEHIKLEHQIAQESSLDALKGRIESLHLVRAERIDYITSEHPVAIAR